MSTSTDAILAYGVSTPWENNDTPWAETHDDHEDWLLEMCGIPLPEYPRPADWDSVTPEEKEALTTYYKAKRAAKAALPVKVVMHCHHEYTMYLVALCGHVITANRGDVLEVGQYLSGPIKKNVGPFMDFCEKIGLEREPPEWLLVSRWF